jgi:hypothetical protein
MRMQRRPENIQYESNSEEELYQIPDASKAATQVAAAFNTEPHPQYLAPENPDLSKIAHADGIMLSSVDIDSLLGPYSGNGAGQTGQHYIDERLLELSSAVIFAPEACDRLAAESVWLDQWYKPALGHSAEIAPTYHFGGSAAPRLGGLY